MNEPAMSKRIGRCLCNCQHRMIGINIDYAMRIQMPHCERCGCQYVGQHLLFHFGPIAIFDQLADLLRWAGFARYRERGQQLRQMDWFRLSSRYAA